MSIRRRVARVCALAATLALAAAFGNAQVTTVTIGSTSLRTGVERFGINLSGQTYYDSGQMLRNLVFRSPGFEGEMWQSVLRCKTLARGVCTDDNPWTVWPEHFLDGARFEVLTGVAAGASGVVTASTGARPPLGVALTLSGAKLPSAGDFLVVRLQKPGSADAGWWTAKDGGATITTEFKDLSPHTPGRQALRVEAAGAGQRATVSSYFDTLAGHSFVQLHGAYRLTFRAKPLAGTHALHVKWERIGVHTFFEKTLQLEPGWHDYSFDAITAEHGAAGNVALTFEVTGASVLLDDVDLEPATRSAANPTAFRDEVVQTLRDLRPGVLRYMDNGTGFGSSLDNLLTPAFARQRAGASTQSLLQEDLPIGLHEFLVLCRAVGAQPWVSLPPGMSAAEMSGLMDYLGGTGGTPYGARRVALGQAAAWTSVFSSIHLELGNEEWNAGSFAGSSLQNAAAYGQRAAALFRAARASPSFVQGRFDLVLGSWASVPWWTEQELKAADSTADSVAVAPYLFSDLDDTHDLEAVFGPMFAQPEQLDSRPDGLMALQAKAARSARRPAKLAVYEVNLSTAAGTASQQAIDLTVPSLGAGLAVADHMLLMLRDLGVTTQALFCLPEFSNGFSSKDGMKKTTPLWGAVIDMGGATNRRRPSFLALEMINQAILPIMLATTVSGANPTWDQAPSANDHVALSGAHAIQSFAYTDGVHRSVVLLNLSRTSSLPVLFAGVNAPRGRVRMSLLTAGNITDSNEERELVKPVSSTRAAFDPGVPLALPPFSMTVLAWDAVH